MRKSQAIIITAFVLSGFAALFAITDKNYGPTWDSAAGEYLYGEENLALYRRIFQFSSAQVRTSPELAADGQSNVSERTCGEGKFEFKEESEDPHFQEVSSWGAQHREQIWPLGPTFSALSYHLFFRTLGLQGPVEARHTFLLILALLLFVSLFQFLSIHFDPLVGFLSVLFLAFYPRFWADLHNNIKDIPSAIFCSLCLLSAAEGFWSENKPRRRKFFLGASFFFGLALSSKGNALFLPIILLPFFSFARYRKHIWEIKGTFLSALFIGPFIALLCWPYLWSEFPDRLVRHLYYVYRFGLSGSSGWHILPAVNALSTMPLPLFITLLVGLPFLPAELQKSRSAGQIPNDSSCFWFLLCWLIIPVLRASVPYAQDYDGIRHWLEFLPPVVIICALSSRRIFSLLTTRWYLQAALGVLLYWPTLRWEIANHPYEIVFYNDIIGGLRGAQQRNLPQATDYWGSSYRAGLQWINENATPNSFLAVGVGEHIVQAVAPIWLRKDLKLIPFADIKKIQTEYPEANIYLMYITRKDKYSKELRRYDEGPSEMHHFVVDVALLLKIKIL